MICLPHVDTRIGLNFCWLLSNTILIRSLITSDAVMNLSKIMIWAVQYYTSEWTGKTNQKSFLPLHVRRGHGNNLCPNCQLCVQGWGGSTLCGMQGCILGSAQTLVSSCSCPISAHKALWSVFGACKLTIKVPYHQVPQNFASPLISVTCMETKLKQMR